MLRELFTPHTPPHHATLAQIRPMLSLFATIDHRYMDGADGAKLAAVVRAVLTDPYCLEAH